MNLNYCNQETVRKWKVRKVHPLVRRLWWWIVFEEWLTDKMRLRLIFSRGHCQRISSLQISDTAGCEPALNRSLLVYWFSGLLCFSPYSVRMWKDKDQKNSQYGHFSGSASFPGFQSCLKYLLLFLLQIWNKEKLGVVSQPFGISLVIQTFSWVTGFRPNLH